MLSEGSVIRICGVDDRDGLLVKEGNNSDSYLVAGLEKRGVCDGFASQASSDRVGLEVFSKTATPRKYYFIP